ncbi:hypothetical protein Tco_0534523 [Tanacetum coccineum]
MEDLFLLQCGEASSVDLVWAMHHAKGSIRGRCRYARGLLTVGALCCLAWRPRKRCWGMGQLWMCRGMLGSLKKNEGATRRDNQITCDALECGKSLRTTPKASYGERVKKALGNGEESYLDSYDLDYPLLNGMEGTARGYLACESQENG